MLDLLVYLVQNRDRVVSKSDLIASVWEGRIVSESTLTSRINAARKAIGDSGEDQKLIRTITRKGFRFVGTVRAEATNQPTGDPDLSLPLPDRPAMAVLPFVNMSGEAEQEYFSDGISEDLITALSKLRWFFVIARNSSFIYKGKSVYLNQVAAELGVRYVVEDSGRKSGDRVRITAQLNDVASGSHLWAERYDRELADVFAVQDEIIEPIVAAIEAQLCAAENFRAQRKPPDSMDAWDLVMRALSHYWRMTRQDSEPVALASVTVLDPAGKELMRIEGAALAAATQTLFAKTATPVVSASAAVSVDVDLILPPDTAPERVTHRIAYTLKADLELALMVGYLEVDAPEVTINREPAMVIRPPLKGKGWLATTACASPTSIETFVSR